MLNENITTNSWNNIQIFFGINTEFNFGFNQKNNDDRVRERGEGGGDCWSINHFIT